MPFPTSPGDGDEYTNALGTVYKYLATDDKWYIISGDLAHNDLSGLNDGETYEHITQTQKDALHDIYTDAEVDARIVIQNTDPAGTIDIAIDSLIGTHASDDNAHHEVIEQGDVDTSISTHAGDDNAHHEVFESLAGDGSPQLGGPLDLNDKQITHELVAAVSLVAGNLCYMNGSGKMAKADASAEATCDTLLAMCLDTISADATGTFLIFGKWTTSGLTAGAEYWVSETAAAITTTRPTTVGSITRHVGTAVSTTILFFNPGHTYVEYV